MFIENMTCAELLAEYKLDYRSLMDKAEEWTYSKDAGKLSKTAKNGKFTMCRQYTTARKNQYYIIILFEQKTEFNGSKYWSTNIAIIGWMRTRKGDTAISFDDEGNAATIRYTPHFFKRYKQRILPICLNWRLKNRLERADNTKDIATIYFERNPLIVFYENTMSYGDKEHVFAPVPDGVNLLQWRADEKGYQANTFITLNMLNIKQRKMIERFCEGKLEKGVKKTLPHLRV